MYLDDRCVCLCSSARSHEVLPNRGPKTAYVIQTHVPGSVYQVYDQPLQQIVLANQEQRLAIPPEVQAMAMRRRLSIRVMITGAGKLRAPKVRTNVASPYRHRGIAGKVMYLAVSSRQELMQVCIYCTLFAA